MRISLSIFLVTYSLLGMAQQAEPFKGANVIVIRTGLSNEDAYTEAGKTLVQNGFSIDVNNKEFLQLKTNFKSPPEYAFTYQITASIKDGDIIIKPAINSNSTVLGTYDWTYLKGKITKNWVVQDDITKIFDGVGEILFDKI